MDQPLEADIIRTGLRTRFIGEPILILHSVDSTNSYAARDVALHGAVVLAEHQTAGKGRMGRDWSSPAGKSILMSVVFLPEQEIGSMLLMTIACGVAVAEGLEQVCGVKPGLKWPNDVLLKGRKVSGVLVESQLAGSTVAKMTAGIGVNVHQRREEFPENLRHPATSLAMEGLTTERNRIIAGILNALEVRYNQLTAGSTQAITESWKRYSLQLGSVVVCRQNGEEFRGVFTDLARDGAAVVHTPDGAEILVNSGEIRAPE